MCYIPKSEDSENKMTFSLIFLHFCSSLIEIFNNALPTIVIIAYEVNRLIKNWLLVGLVITATNMGLFAQQESLSNQYTKEFQLIDSVLTLDSLSIVPGSVNVDSDIGKISEVDYVVQNNNIIFKDHIVNDLNIDKVVITYRVLGLNFEESYNNLDSSIMESPVDRIVYIGHDLSPYDNKSTRRLIQSDGLSYDGSFTRGFSLGNSQSLVLNSNFNLQMSGDLGDGMTIEAAISDDNLPIQADGNTQLLQEFDQVYMRINKNKTSIIAGDYETGRPNSYFMNYFKKLKGLSVQNTEQLEEGFTISSRANYAVARGKFSRNTLPIQEGNQGPYRLVGNQGERLVKVLSGTEKVYLDGRLLTRGLDHDYVISYDRAELNFTPNILITKDSRVIVEFEFADQNYLRTQYGAGVDLKKDKLELNFNLYNEQDSKTATGDIDLDSLDLAILSEAGDNFDQAFRSGVTRFNQEDIDFDPVLYSQRWEESIGDSVLVYTPDASIARYTASFSDIGTGQGSYIIDNTVAANGRAYKWVGPNLGRYDPVIKLIPPEKRQLVTLGGKYHYNGKSFIRGELAMSNFDLNRFAQVGNDDNTDVAGTIGFDHNSKLGADEKKISLQTSGGIEIVGNNFNFLNPYRNAEFARDWNLSTDEKRQERISNFKIGIEKSNKAYVNYSFQNFNRQELYDGNKNVFGFGVDDKGWKIDGVLNFLGTTSLEEETSFSRPIFDISKQFSQLGDWTLGMHYEQENNKRNYVEEINLNTASFKYEYIKTFVQSPQYDNFNLRVGYNQRKDFTPQEEIFEESTLAKEFQVSGNWKQGEQSRLIANVIVRDLSITDTQLTTIAPNRTFLGRVDYDLNLFNKALRSNTSLQVGSGQQAKAEFEYVMVQKGQGQYIWLDDGDGVQETFEFQVAPVQDTANFVRLAIFNNEFVRTNDNSLNQNIRFEGRDLFSPEERSGNKSKSFFSKISALVNVRINKKAEDSGPVNSFSPFDFSSLDTNLISYTGAFNNTLFFNRGNPVFDIQIGNRKNISRFVQVAGAESNRLKENFFRLRWGVSRATDLLLNLSNGNRSQTYELSQDNSYEFNFFAFNPEINFRPKKNIRFIIDYIYQNRKTTNDELAVNHEFSGEVTLRQANKTNLTAGLGFVTVDYDGQTNTNLELAILDGLKKGQNYLWNLALTRRMANNIDLIISYDGRKTGTSRTIHTGRAQVKATF